MTINLIDKLKRAEMLILFIVEDPSKAHSVLDLWPDCVEDEDPLLEELWHEIMYFTRDAKIRDLEPQYAARQVAQLINAQEKIRERITALEANPEEKTSWPNLRLFASAFYRTTLGLEDKIKPRSPVQEAVSSVPRMNHKYSPFLHLSGL